MLSRTLRKTIGRVLIGVLLSAQFAVASHACPGMSATDALDESSVGEVLAVPAESGSAGDSIDPGPLSNVCVEHCRHGQQSSDSAQAPVVHVAIPTFLYALPVEAGHWIGASRACQARIADSAAGAPAPPHTILHCVLRF